MARVSNLSDEALRDYLDKGIPQEQIAKLYKISPAAVSQRVKALEARTMARAPENVTRSHRSLWDTRQAAEDNFHRALFVLEQECETPSDKIRAIGEIRQHLTFAMQVLETLYTVQETQAFMDEVLAVIDGVDGSAKQRILSRLAEKRTLRAAFLPPA